MTATSPEPQADPLDEPVSPADADRQRRRDYKELFNTPLGQRVLADLMKRGGIFGNVSHVGENGQVDPYRMAAAEGGRDLVLYILTTSDQQIATPKEFVSTAHRSQYRQQ